MTEKKKNKAWKGLSDQTFFNHLPFILFLTLLGVLYIANSYYVEGTVREMESIKKKINEQKNEFVITKTEVSLKGQRNEIIEKVKPLGLEESKIPPFQIQDKSDK